jgi:PIN domain nuclease of toxin-antitoxin system
MRLLLDTHVLLWWMFEHPRLTPDLKSLVADESNTILVSGVSAFEISTKQALGKLDAPDDLDGQVEASGFTALPLTIRHGLAAGRLPLHHRDPFDRLLVAQAAALGLPLITADPVVASYPVETVLVA